MTAPTLSSYQETPRSSELLQAHQDRLHRRTDRLFGNLMLVQWIAGIGAALWISPRTWIGAESQIHFHVWAAVLLGGVITSLPVLLVWVRPGLPATRHVIAVGQMLTSALLIHLTGGRMETHFHIFGSLAFLAIYRDWRVLLTATLVTALDHYARGTYWPQSVFGVLATSHWRWLEHVGWVIFENAFLCISIHQSLGEMRDIAVRRATLEDLNANIERQVAERTSELATALRDLQTSEQRFRMLSASAPIGIFEADAEGHVVYMNPYLVKISGLGRECSLGVGWQEALHPDDAVRVIAAWRRAVAEGGVFNDEYRCFDAKGDLHWLHTRTAIIRSEAGEVVCHVGTAEDISERKRGAAELEKMYAELMKTSRQAGMAEVATAVLHNVGNVLNSVNVASRCVAESLRKSKAASLGRVVELLREHEADLGGFFATDPRGRQLPGFLAQLADHLTTQQTTVSSELGHLQRNIEHIKQIVAMQQSYARTSGSAEPVRITDLVEDTLRMNAESLIHHDLRVVRDFAEVPPVTVAVADNGIGISPENLGSIFKHGFTTKKDGHGFGLHSGAVAAQELGGNLRVESPGAGQGATFTLELPCVPPHSTP
jgi:PAS domain S-box-containing protein